MTRITLCTLILAACMAAAPHASAEPTPPCVWTNSADGGGARTCVYEAGDPEVRDSDGAGRHADRYPDPSAPEAFEARDCLASSREIDARIAFLRAELAEVRNSRRLGRLVAIGRLTVEIARLVREAAGVRRACRAGD